MTTAHRPTWKPALGMSNAANKGYVPTRSYSARDLPGYLTLKQRSWGQGSIDELREKDFKAELIKREAELKNKQLQNQEQLQILNKEIKDNDPDLPAQMRKKILRPGQEADEQPQIAQQNEVNPFPQDQDDNDFIKEASNDSDSDEDSEDDNEVLLREFEKVKQQREREDKKKMEEKAKYSAANRQSELLKGNPLLGSTYSLAKRWYEDTVFKNQAKRVQEKKSYVNDNVRSEFHRKFINKYVMR